MTQQPNKSSLTHLKQVFTEKILKFRDPITGLTPQNNFNHAWIRDNLYLIHSLFAFSQAYNKQYYISSNLNDYTDFYEFKLLALQSMRSILNCFLLEKEKINLYKNLANRYNNLTKDLANSPNHLNLLRVFWD